MFKIALNSLWAHKRRLISTCVAVVLGVAFMAGTLVLTSTINSIFDDLFAKTNLNTDAIVRGPVLFKDQQQGTVRDKIPESTIQKVKDQPHVVQAEGQISTMTFTLLDHNGDPMGGQGPPTFFGSWVYDKALNDYRIVEGREPKTATEVVINKAAATEGKLELGKTVKVVTPKGTKRFELVGLARFGDADSSGGVIVVATTLQGAQDLLGEPDRVDWVLARGDGTVSSEALAKQLQDAKLAPKADVITGKAQAEETASEIKDAFGFFSTILLVFAAIALFVGAFIISNTFGILLAQRTRELALMRAIGAGRNQVFGSVVLEALVVGLVSAVIGLAAGIGLASGALAALRAAGLDLPSAGITLTPSAAAAAVLVGVVLTMGAAVLPAVRATRVPPIAALRDVAIDTSGSSPGRGIAGAIFVVIGGVLTIPAFGDNPGKSLLPIGIGLGLVILGVLVLGPVLAKPLAAVVGAPLPAIKGITGTISRQNAVRSPRRTASTASALIIGVTLVVFITVFAASVQSSISNTIGRGFEGDYIVQPASQGGGPNAGASPKLAQQLAKVPGVKDVTAVTFFAANLGLPGGGKDTTGVGGIDPATYREIFHVNMAKGSISDLERGTMIVDRQVARDKGIELGDKVKVTSLAGRSGTYRVAAIGDEPVLLGSYTLNKADAAALTPTPTDFLVGITLDKGRSVESMRAPLKKVVRQYPTMKLQDRDQFTGSIVAQIKALLNVIYGLLAVSIIIALIGIANTLSLSINERTRELGLLRAMGMTRAQLRSSVRWEATIIALMGTAIGLVIGVAASWILVKALVDKGITTFAVPVSGLVTVVVFGAALGILASVRPSWRASKLNVLEAIASE